ncbi:hypothetical protein ACFL01_04630, partial [Planctomycetota bacterium]
LLSIGMVSILALFPKALYSARNVMEVTMASSVGRSAYAQLVADALDNYIADSGGVDYHEDYDGDASTTWWPVDLPDSSQGFSGTIQELTPGSADTVVGVTDIGTWVTTDNVVNSIQRYLFLITSGRGRNRLYPMKAALGLNYSGTDDRITIEGTSAKPVNLYSHGVRVGDSFQIIGPGVIGPVQEVGLDEDSDGDFEETFYSWIAVICGDGAEDIDGLHTVMIFVFNRDLNVAKSPGSETLDQAAAGDTVRYVKPVYYFTGAISEPGE